MKICSKCEFEAEDAVICCPICGSDFIKFSREMTLLAMKDIVETLTDDELQTLWQYLLTIRNWKKKKTFYGVH